MRKFTIYLPAALLLATVAVAQQGTPPAPKQYQTPNQYEPANGPGAGQKLLEKFVGNWTFVDTFYPTRGGATRVTKGTCKQYMILGGKFLQSDFTFMPDNRPQYTGEGLSGFDPGTDTFTTMWMDSQRTEMSIRASTPPFDGKNIVLSSSPIDNEPGRKTVAKAHLEDNGQTLIYDHYLIGPDGKEKLMFEIKMTKQ